MDVLVVGDANPDLILRGDVRPRFGQAEQLLTAADLVLGGSASITAAGLGRLGVRTALLTKIGRDVFGDVTRRAITGRGVELREVDRDDDTPTGISVILSEVADKAILTLPGTIPVLRPSDITGEHLAGVRHLHVASLYLQPALAAGLADVFGRARASGLTTSLDTNWDPTGKWESIGAILEHTDVFLPNANELRAVTGLSDLDEAARSLGDTTVVMKDGEHGARAWWDGRRVATPGHVVDVVDTTGAGDSFNAGFLAARLQGETVESALRWAVAAGSLSTRAAGGTAAQATREDVLALIGGA
ncbi:sugar kinase [Actinoplanes sp. NBRC 103695]|uniref:carbohydrate kinase family protein n=1 Tax=Actinoplanes sp. NBRC 103695 TaxID=3032202 RepID=UPI0024A14E07|nr:sugar kinase [Actinoplanes sp. NBRC 103695]GLY98476.1 sugar kinase [Actinoplanes sp. NBRC 103695]